MRPTFAAIALVAATPALALDCPEGERAFAHAAGEACIPENPQRIVATRHDSIVTPLIELGAPLVGVGVAFDSATGEAFIRGATDILGVNVGPESGLTSIGNANEPDLEIIAGLAPDLILILEWQADLKDRLDLIAPTVVVPDGLTYLDHLALVADAAGVSGTYDTKLAAYEARIAEIRGTLGDPSAITISYLDLWEEGVWHYINWGARDQVTADVGFARPDIVRDQGADEGTDYSFELLPAFDGDIVLSSHANRFGQTVAALSAEWDGYAPFWRGLPAVQEGRHHWYPRDLWVGYTFTSLMHVADSLALLTVGRDFD
jgi:iron complex transport system substrate-binding protein